MEKRTQEGALGHTNIGGCGEDDASAQKTEERPVLQEKSTRGCERPRNQVKKEY